jgi:soluble lytic murein transglycosylase
MLFASLAVPVHASPDIPMCSADRPTVSLSALDFVQWRAPMCGPYLSEVAIAQARPRKSRAIKAYREASRQIAAVNYEDARLHLDLAYRGLPRIRDRIALQSARLELLRERPTRAAEFFAEALGSPHRTVRVEARLGRALALLRADDPEADQALEELLWSYPALPKRPELLFEHAQSLLRRGRHEEAIAAMHGTRVHTPGSPVARWAERELERLRALGYPTPALSDEERVLRARYLVSTGPLPEAKASIAELLDSPLSGTLHADVHYLAGRLARDEGRWTAAETYLRTAQLFAIEDPATARYIETRASDMAATAGARDPLRALRLVSELRAGRANAIIPPSRLVEMIRIAAAAELQNEVDGILTALVVRAGTRPGTLFDAAMAAVGSADESQIIAVLKEVATRPGYRPRAAVAYHLARAHERAGRDTESTLFFGRAKEIAESTNDGYYALWAENGLARVERGARSAGLEGLANPSDQSVPAPPRVSGRELAKQLAPIAELHLDSLPWIARAADLLRVEEHDAATAELFEAYLAWRDALGKPVARAGLSSIARAENRTQEPIATDVRAARLGLSLEERETLSKVSAVLGDMGTAGGFAGSELLDTRPRAYEWLVVPAANRYGLDPNLLLAVMRVESVYQKHIVSYAGAVGLMQIMPRTGQLIAHALGDDDFTPADLLDPRRNVEFAAWYLSSLIRRFDGRLPLAIASYNGGPHNVRRWIQESADATPVDVLLERIPFTQTHRYVRKVLVHYEAYRRQHELAMPQLSVEQPAQRVDPLAF